MEQGLLGRPISIHAAVVIQVVLREVGEHGDSNAGPVQAMFSQPNRGSFDGAVLQARVGKCSELLLQQHRVWCGHAGARQMGQLTHAQSAHQTAGAAQYGRRQGLRQPPGGRGLAIGTRHRQHVQLFAGVFVIGIRHQPRLGLEIAHAGQTLQLVLGDILLTEVLPRLRSFLRQNTGTGTLSQGIFQIQTSISRGTWPCDESVTGLNQTAVGAQLTRHALTQPTCSFQGRVEGLHQKDSSTDLATIWGLTAMSG